MRQLDAAVEALKGAAPPAPNPSAPPLIAAEAESPPHRVRPHPYSALSYAGSIRAYFKGNGTNVLKIAPETSIKLGLNDYLRHHIHAETDSVAPWERMLCGGISGAVGQVRERRRRESMRSPCVDDSMTCMWHCSSQCCVCSAPNSVLACLAWALVRTHNHTQHAGPCVPPGHCAHAAGCVQQHRVRRHPAHCRQAVAHRGPRSLLQGACTINGACV